MADHKRRKKKRGRSKLFRSCFRSFATERPPFSHPNKSDHQNSKLTGGKPVFLSVISDRQGDDNSNLAVDHRCSSHRRSVSRLLKSINLFDAVMVYKIHSSSKSSIASDNNESFQSTDGNANACGTESTDVEDSSTSNLVSSSSSRNTSSSYSSSSSNSSTNSHPRWSSDQKSSSPVDLIELNSPISTNVNLIKSSSKSCYEQKIDPTIPKPKRTNSTPQSSSYSKKLLSEPDVIDSSNLISSSSDKIKSGCSNNWNIRWCSFLLLSLVVLVIYGRIYAILCTSIWFYLVPCRRVERVNSVSNVAGFMDTESEQYKKRVIMAAGLLDRTRNPPLR